MVRGKATRGSSTAKRRPNSVSIDGKNDDSRTVEQRLEAIEYHWRSFSPLAKKFLLSNPRDLTLEKLIQFWSSPDEIQFAQMAVSIGTSHLLAYEYFNISAFENARALTLNGAFLQQCAVS